MSQIRIEEEIAAPAERVWELLGAFGGLEQWAPGITSCKLEGSGIGALRRVAMGAMTIVERLESLDPAARRFSYSIAEGPLPLENYLATVSVSPAGAKACTVLWTARFDAGALPAEAVRGMAQGIEGSYRGMLQGLRKKLGA